VNFPNVEDVDSLVENRLDFRGTGLHQFGKCHREASKSRGANLATKQNPECLLSLIDRRHSGLIPVAPHAARSQLA
jgi:hypothetical protein